MSTLDLDAIERALAEARDAHSDCGAVLKPRTCSPCYVADNAPTWLAQLVAEVRRLQAENDRLHSVINSCRSTCKYAQQEPVL